MFHIYNYWLTLGPTSSFFSIPFWIQWFSGFIPDFICQIFWKKNIHGICQISIIGSYGSSVLSLLNWTMCLQCRNVLLLRSDIPRAPPTHTSWKFSYDGESPFSSNPPCHNQAQPLRGNGEMTGLIYLCVAEEPHCSLWILSSLLLKSHFWLVKTSFCCFNLMFSLVSTTALHWFLPWNLRNDWLAGLCALPLPGRY